MKGRVNMIGLIKNIICAAKKSCVFVVVVSFALQLCLLDSTFKQKLDQLLFYDSSSYDIIKMSIKFNQAIIIIIICLDIFLYGLYSLLFSIDMQQYNISVDDILYKHINLKKNINSVNNMIVPSLIILYLLTVIMSIHTSMDFALEYVISHFVWYQLLLFLASYIPVIIMKIYEYEIYKDY